MKKLVKRTFACAGAVVAAAVFLCACSPQSQSEGGSSADDSGKSVIEVAWSPQADCSVCHATEQASYGNAACLASSHQQEACISCHSDEQALADVHADKTSADKAPKKLKKTEVSDEQCLSCHYGSREGLVAATPDAMVVDDNGTSRNPHDAGGVTEHEGVQCSSCHDMHSEEPLAEQALNTCLGCHHAGVFECYTCHE